MNATHEQPMARGHLADAQPMERYLSALVDGELRAGEMAESLGGDTHNPELYAIWHRYQVIGDVLRGSGPAVSARPPGVFLADFRARLQIELPAAAAIDPPEAVVVHVRAPAANDPVFRWKLVAGLASVAAVMAVSWQVVALSPAAPGAAAPQLALTAPASVVPVKATSSLAQAESTEQVLVNTQQGTVIRDARLEELLAAHRQVGGASALQMPAGFLRNATYDAPAR